MPRQHFATADVQIAFAVAATRHVKSYAPHVHHFVADVVVEPSEPRRG